VRESRLDDAADRAAWVTEYGGSFGR